MVVFVMDADAMPFPIVRQRLFDPPGIEPSGVLPSRAVVHAKRPGAAVRGPGLDLFGWNRRQNGATTS